MLAAACLAAGCSSVRLAYNNVPTVGTWWLDGYLDIDSTQSARLREDLTSLQQWHRSTQLPEMAGLLLRSQQLAAQPALQAPQVCALVDEVQDQLADIGARSEPGAVQLVRSLTPAQLEHLQERYAKSNRDYRKEWLDLGLEQVADKRYEKTLERAEHFYGRLDAEQRALLRRLVDDSRFDPQRVNAERLRRQQDTVQTLRALIDTPATPEQMELALRGLFARYRKSPQPDYQAYARRQIEQGCDGLAQLHASATPAQREHAVRRLQSYERDLRALAAQR